MNEEKLIFEEKRKLLFFLLYWQIWCEVLFVTMGRSQWTFLEENTVLVLRMAHRIWKETKQQPNTAGPGNMLDCCLVSFLSLWDILSTSTVIAKTNKSHKNDAKPL